jgi:CBS domain containing-hemolysin-like protein
MTGILKLSKVSVSEIMIHMKDMYMLSDSIKLDDNILHAILRSGYSRIPIFKRKDKQHIKGYLLVKTLVIINPNDKIAIESLDLREPLVVRPTLGLLEMLNMFREGECHLALVSKDPMKALKSIKDGNRPMESASIVGMVTLEDVIEKMIQYEIVDETDVKPNKYPHHSCSSTLLYHNVGKSYSNPYHNITKTTNNNSLDDSNNGIVNIHTNDTDTDTDTNDMTSTYYQLNT